MIYALIPVKDRVEYTIKCIESFKKQTYKDVKIVVINDGSVDGTKDKIEALWKDVTILQGDGNLWCMGAFAMGVDYVKPLLKEGDSILTQNQDAFMDNDFVQELINVITKYPKSVVGSINFSSKEQKPIYHNHIIKNGAFMPNIIQGELPEIIERTDTLNTRGTLFSKEAIEAVGNFSKLFPHYAGDYEITCRAKKKGFKLLIASKAVCYSWDDNKGLAYRIKNKQKKTLKDVVDLFSSRRSPNNLYYSKLLILLHIPFPQKIYGILRITAYAIKFILVDYLFNSVIKQWKS